MSFFDWLLNKKKKELPEFPFHYIKVVFTESARHDGVFDDFNKEIQRIKGGEIIQRISYTNAELESMKKVYLIPVVDITKITDKEDFEFEKMESLTGLFREVL